MIQKMTAIVMKYYFFFYYSFSKVLATFSCSMKSFFLCTLGNRNQLTMSGMKPKAGQFCRASIFAG